MATQHRPMPYLSYGEWEPTKKALHRFIQIIGKMRLQDEPPRNHWWHVPFYVTTRGFGTGPIPSDNSPFPETFEFEFDLLSHCLTGRTSGGESFSIALQGLTVADFYAKVTRELFDMGLEVPIHPYPYKLEPKTRFDLDREHVYTDVDAAYRYFQVARFADEALKTFASHFIGKESPVHLFWHSLDLSMTRYSGRLAPNPPDPSKDAVEYEAYSHEVANFGFWPGDESFREPAFFATFWPEPEGLHEMVLAPAEAFWSKLPNQTMALLRYSSIKDKPNPREDVVSFFESAYDAGATLGHWDRGALESARVGENRSRHLSHMSEPGGTLLAPPPVGGVEGH